MQNIIKDIEPKFISTIYRLSPKYKKKLFGGVKIVVPEAWYKPGEKEPADIEPANNFVIPDDTDPDLAYLFESGKRIYEENGKVKIKRYTYLSDK